ncbi:ArdC-like ssDNA-binding domain-containing protein [Alicyclobacillus macrosporangiidus]|uniref:ArdC-like ssDNA-binding domain-containing protein n=1 Tax=Alicyclobacillus macrosporangiidus TaxID=392015 RepID=UPI00068FA80B|nr:ArdC-like ssDNA-binding domain-containing protein [Alicyclobacillus macrosporangiidus]
MSNCLRCFRKLLAVPSIRRGVGPVCAKNLRRDAGLEPRIPRGWSALTDERVQRFLRRPLVRTNVPDERAPLITTQGAMLHLAPSIRPLEEYSAEELQEAAQRVPRHQYAAFADEPYRGPNKELYMRARAMGLSESSAAQLADRGALSTGAAAVDTDEAPLQDEPYDASALDLGTKEQAFVTRSRDERVRQAYERMNRLLDELYDSDKFREYLKFVASMPRYSFHNQLLIFSQRPNATLVAGYKKWTEMGRHVMRGEKGIKIFAPLFKNVEEADETGETVVVRRLSGFKLVTVFDVSQTEGNPLPTLDVNMNIEGDRHQALYDRLARVVSRTIPIKHLPEDQMDGARGWYDPLTGEIALSEKNTPNQNAKTLIHEYAHALLHTSDAGRRLPRQQKEVEAEAVAFVVCEAFGFDTSDQSVGYVAGWSGGHKRLFRESMERITRTARQIIEEIERESEAEAERTRNFSA